METGTLPVKLQPTNLRPTAYRILSKKHGLNIQTDALKELTSVISLKFGSEWKSPRAQAYLEDIGKFWKLQDRGLFIDGEGLKEVVKQMDQDVTPVDEENKENIEYDQLQWRDYFKIINPPDQPNYAFDKQRKQFTLKGKPTMANFASANIDYFNQRYSLIRDRLSRNEVFQKTNYQSISNIRSKKLTKEITLIKNITGKNGESFILFGLLSKNYRGCYTLEDSSDSIELNLEQAHKIFDAFYTEGMFVTIEGLYSQFNENSPNGIFHVTHIGHPPAERRDISSEHYGNLDFLNINKENISNMNHISRVNRDFKKALVKAEKQHYDHKFIVLGSDIHLDEPKILKGLKKFFNKLENDLIDDVIPPITLVMIGSFVSIPINSVQSSMSSISNSELYKNNFNNLASLIGEFTNISTRVKFLLIPGPNDPWQSSHSLGSSNLNYLPQSPIPSVFLTRLERLLPKGNLVVGWNPVRMNYLSQEIVLLKDELMSKFNRNDIILDSDGNDSHEILSENPDNNVSPTILQARKLVKTLLDQGHLQPFSKSLKLVNPIYSHCLKIEPLPNLIIFNDTSFKNTQVPYTGCRVITLSNFLSDNRVTYLEYYPSTRNCDFKEIYI